jgi:hypothetical protein
MPHLAREAGIINEANGKRANQGEVSMTWKNALPGGVVKTGSVTKRVEPLPFTGEPKFAQLARSSHFLT